VTCLKSGKTHLGRLDLIHFVAAFAVTLYILV
jgi:hypothetical protein